MSFAGDSRWVLGNLNIKSFFNAVIYIFLEITILSVATCILEIIPPERRKSCYLPKTQPRFSLLPEGPSLTPHQQLFLLALRGKSFPLCP